MVEAWWDPRPVNLPVGFPGITIAKGKREARRTGSKWVMEMGSGGTKPQPARQARFATEGNMTKLQLLAVTVLAAFVLGGGGYLAFDALHPYRHLVQTEGGERVAYVPPIVAEIERARKLRAEGKRGDAQKLLHKQLRISGKRPEAKAARELLGEINTDMFFSTEVPFGKTEYVVQRGDSLWRIARKLDSTPGVIMRTNNMASDRLQPGDKLFVPTAEIHRHPRSA
jgi:nucleoid-associated protein YgaU